jgi:aminocarboxymuconate-semialdehyde decarboxylase
MARQLIPSIDKALGEDAWQLARRFWFDSNVYDAGTLKVLTDRIGLDRLVVGSDYPFLIRQSHPGAFVEGALPGSAAQCCNNAHSLLGRHH